MSKIVRAVNSMILNPSKISNVSVVDEEYFFMYDGKYKWSIKHYVSDYLLYFFPEDETIDNLVKYIESKPSEYPDYVFYNSDDLKTREAAESFGELYLIVKEKLYGLDKILDDIIEAEELEF